MDLKSVNDSLVTLWQAEEIEDYGSTAFKYWVEGVLLTGVSVLGISANALSVAVLSRPEMKSPFSQILSMLAGYDFVYLVTSILIFGLPELSSYYREEVHALILPIIFGIGHIGRVGSVFLTLSITIERFVAVSKPLYTEKKQLKNILMIGSAAFSFFYNIPRFFELTYETQTISEGIPGINESQRIVYIPNTSELRRNTTYMTVHFWTKIVLVELGPYILLSTLNAFIIVRARRSSQLQPRSELASKKEIQMVRVLFLIVIMFIICQSFKIIPDLYEVFQCSFGEKGIPECWESPLIVQDLTTLSHLALSVNSSANFFVYVAWGSKFRNAFTRLLKPSVFLQRNATEDRRALNMSIFTENNRNIASESGSLISDMTSVSDHGGSQQDHDPADHGSSQHDHNSAHHDSEQLDHNSADLGSSQHDNGSADHGSSQHDHSSADLGSSQHDNGSTDHNSSGHDKGYADHGSSQHDKGCADHGSSQHYNGSADHGSSQHDNGSADNGSSQLDSSLHHGGGFNHAAAADSCIDNDPSNNTAAELVARHSRHASVLTTTANLSPRKLSMRKIPHHISAEEL